MSKTLANPLPAAVPTEVRQQALVPYDPELAMTICERIAGGELMKAICEEDGYPSPTAFHGWILRDETLAKVYGQAREMQGHFYFDRMLEVANETVDGEMLNPKAAAVAIGAYSSAAARLAPRYYSDKAQKVPAIAIQINTTLGLGGSGAEAVQSEEGVYTVEAYIVPEGEPDGESTAKPPVPAKASAKRRESKAKRGRVG